MKKIIKKIKHYYKVSKRIHVNVYASAATFNIVVVLIPLFILIMQLLGMAESLLGSLTVKGILSTSFKDFTMALSEFSNIALSVGIFLVSVVWSSSQAVHTVSIVGQMLAKEKKKRSFLARFASFIFMFTFVGFFIVLFVTYNIITAFIKRLFERYLLIYLVLNFILLFLLVTLLLSVVYRFVLPRQTTWKRSLRTCLELTGVWFAVTAGMQLFLNIFTRDSYARMYQAFAGVFIIVNWIYILVYIFILFLAVQVSTEETVQSIKI